jgi:hypothetical protein
MEDYVMFLGVLPPAMLSNRLEVAAKFFLVTDVIEHLLGPDPFPEWVSELAICAEFIRRLLDAGYIRHSVLLSYLATHRHKGEASLYNVLALVLRESAEYAQPIGKQVLFMRAVASRLSYGSTVQPGSVEAAIVRDNVVEFRRRSTSTNSRLIDSFHSFREAEDLFGLCVYSGAVNCFKFVIWSDPAVSKRLMDPHIPEIAVRSGNLEIVNALVEIGVDFTPVRAAAISYHRYDLFEWITGGEAIPLDLVACLRSKNGEIIRRHEKAFAEFAREDIEGLCRLCIRCGFPAGLAWLLRLCNVEINGRELVKLAIALKDTDSLMVLVRSQKVDVRNPVGLFGATLLHWAAKKGHIQLIQELLPLGDFGLTDYGFSALDYAVLHGQHSCAELLRELPRSVYNQNGVKITIPFVFIDHGGWLERVSIHGFWEQAQMKYPEVSFMFRGEVIPVGIPLVRLGIQKQSVLRTVILSSQSNLNKIQ